MAIPSIECKMLLNNGKRYSKTNEDAFLPYDALHPITSPTPITPPKMNIFRRSKLNNESSREI